MLKSTSAWKSTPPLVLALLTTSSYGAIQPPCDCHQVQTYLVLCKKPEWSNSEFRSCVQKIIIVKGDVDVVLTLYRERRRWRWKATTRRVAAWKTNGLSAKPISIVDQAPPHCEQETFDTVDSGSPVDVNAEWGWENLLGCSQTLRSKNSAFSHKFVFVKNRTERSERSPCFHVGRNWHCWECWAQPQ